MEETKAIDKTLDTAPHAIVCLHGLGASSSSFDDLKKSFHVEQYEFMTPDCPGHAKQVEQTYHGDPLAFAAETISAVIRQKGQKVTLIGHSMGGALAVLIVQKIPDHIAALISIEGNLIAEDCGLLSRTIATAQGDELIKLKHELVETAAKSKNSGWQTWAKDVSRVAPQTLKDYAASLVKYSNSGDLLNAFALFDGPKAYVYGDGYIGHPLIAKLGAIPSYHVTGADHFVMQDDPDVCARLIKKTASGNEAGL